MMHRLACPTGLPALVGTELGTSSWKRIDQETVDDFARITGDRQWIHVDPCRAATGPFGRPVAHGFLVVSLIPAMLAEVIMVDGVDHILNKGVDGIRLGAAVGVGARLRARIELRSARARPRGYWESVFGVQMETEVDATMTVVLRAGVTYLYRADDNQSVRRKLPSR
ncbi:MaoC family dehydratase [Solwaraspora sp. WMMB335]|uniref:MaoC family dehydratase n=1 Tax=Solwaraspora sp. WMMB335 TaxID=3404118 RepID=UPI003B94235E